MTDQRSRLNLTDQQQQIVAHTHGPALVYAVAGAGKTTAMVHRVARLVHERMFAPEQILVSSFNRAAVDDLGRALAAWPACGRVARMTLHALGFAIVRHAAERGLFPPLDRDAVQADGGERQIIVALRKAAQRSRAGSAAELEGFDEQALLNYIGACKGNLQYADLRAAGLPPAALRTARQAEPPPDQPHFLTLYKLYEQVRVARGWLTFDDMLLLAWEAFQREPALLAEWQQRYAAVLVDEFQDVNLAQAELLDLLTAQHRNYMAIGDDDQTIYGFRGARMDFFRSFEQRYGAAVYTMTDNFRCQGAQVLLANRVIAQNDERQPKVLTVTRGFGGTTLLHKAPDASTMARRIAAEAQTFHTQGYRLAEIAVLVRLTAQTPVIEQALAQAGIAYQIAGDEPFYRRREIVELLMYPELAVFDAALRAGKRLKRNHAERLEQCWRRLAHRPTRYLTRQMSDAVLQAAVRRGEPLSASLHALSADLNERRAGLVQAFADLLIWLGDAPADLPASTLLNRLEQLLGYQDFLRTSGGGEAGEGAAQNVQAFVQYAEGKGSLAALHAHLEQLAQQRAATQQIDRDAVDIRTIHRAKGLEWPVVLIPHCNNGYLPAQHADDWDEECRLLYVAITRAQRHLRLYALDGGKHQPSPFLVEAQAEQVLQAAETIGAALTTDPERWTAAQALHVATCPRLFGQERFFRLWWDVPSVQRQAIARRVLEFIAAAKRRRALDNIGIQAADERIWAECAGSFVPRRDAAFPGFEPLCAARGSAQQAALPTIERRPASYKVGEQVAHTTFGVGVVVALEAHGSGRTSEWYVTVYFPQRGNVKLLSSIAPLQRIG